MNNRMDNKKETRKTIGANIRKLRKDKGLLQPQLSELLGLSSSGHLSLIERGERGLPSDKLIQVAKIFGVHPSVLFSEKPSSMEYAYLMGLLSKILLSENKPQSFEALKILIKSIADECDSEK